jgi:hypothetical protein
MCKAVYRGLSSSCKPACEVSINRTLGEGTHVLELDPTQIDLLASTELAICPFNADLEQKRLDRVFVQPQVLEVLDVRSISTDGRHQLPISCIDHVGHIQLDYSSRLFLIDYASHPAQLEM